jgi:anti-sigma regulatory factor (Ser/Thr protein kinase)
MEERRNDGERSWARRSPVRETLHLVVDRPAQLVDFRRRVRGMLRDHGLTKAEREAVVLAAAEALNNALNACETDECRVEVKVSLVGEFICVEVRDADERFRGACLDLQAAPDTSAEQGRGLFLMHSLMQSLEIVPRKQGTLVRMTKRLEADERPVGAGGDNGGNDEGEAA